MAPAERRKVLEDDRRPPPLRKRKVLDRFEQRTEAFLGASMQTVEPLDQRATFDRRRDATNHVEASLETCVSLTGRLAQLRDDVVIHFARYVMGFAERQTVGSGRMEA
jgi:hypothetical protein